MIIPEEVKRLARAGKDKKIHAIAALRRATGISLALAKEFVETLAAGGEVQLPVDNETREERILRQLAHAVSAGYSDALTDEETRRLLALLQGDEDMLGAARGKYHNCTGLLIATS